MKVPSMVECAALIGYLQAALAHSEVHGVHVNGTREWLLFGSNGHISVFVFVDRYLDLNFFAPALSYRLYQTRKSRMPIYCLVKYKLGLGEFVYLSKVIFVLYYFLFEFSIVRYEDVILCSEHGSICGTYKLKTS